MVVARKKEVYKETSSIIEDQIPILSSKKCQADEFRVQEKKSDCGDDMNANEPFRESEKSYV